MTVAVAVGSGALVPGWGEGSTTGTGGVGEATNEAGVLADGAGAGVAAWGDAAGTATDGVPGLEGAGVEAAGAEAMGEGVVAGEVTETVGRGPAASDSDGSDGSVVQPATHRPKMRQAAVIAVVLFTPRSACMTAPRSCPPVPPTLGRDGGTQHAVTVTVRTRVGHAPSKAAGTRMPPPRHQRNGGIEALKTRLLLLRPERRSGAQRCP